MARVEVKDNDKGLGKEALKEMEYYEYNCGVPSHVEIGEFEECNVARMSQEEIFDNNINRSMFVEEKSYTLSVPDYLKERKV